MRWFSFSCEMFHCVVIIRPCSSNTGCPAYHTMDSLRTYLLEVFDMHETESLLYYQRQKRQTFYTMMQLNSTIGEYTNKRNSCVSNITSKTVKQHI